MKYLLLILCFISIACEERDTIDFRKSHNGRGILETDDPMICSLIYVSNYVRGGEYHNTTGGVFIDNHFNSDILDSTLDYELYDWSRISPEVHYGQDKVSQVKYGSEAEYQVLFPNDVDPNDFKIPIFRGEFSFDFYGRREGKISKKTPATKNNEAELCGKIYFITLSDEDNDSRSAKKSTQKVQIRSTNLVASNVKSLTPRQQYSALKTASDNMRKVRQIIHSELSRPLYELMDDVRYSNIMAGVNLRKMSFSKSDTIQSVINDKLEVSKLDKIPGLADTMAKHILDIVEASKK